MEGIKALLSQLRCSITYERCDERQKGERRPVCGVNFAEQRARAATSKFCHIDAKARAALTTPFLVVIIQPPWFNPASLALSPAVVTILRHAPDKYTPLATRTETRLAAEFVETEEVGDVQGDNMRTMEIDFLAEEMSDGLHIGTKEDDNGDNVLFYHRKDGYLSPKTETSQCLHLHLVEGPLQVFGGSGGRGGGGGSKGHSMKATMRRIERTLSDYPRQDLKMIILLDQPLDSHSRAPPPSSGVSAAATMADEQEGPADNAGESLGNTHDEFNRADMQEGDFLFLLSHHLSSEAGDDDAAGRRKQPLSLPQFPGQPPSASWCCREWVAAGGMSSVADGEAGNGLPVVVEVGASEHRAWGQRSNGTAMLANWAWSDSAGGESEGPPADSQRVERIPRPTPLAFDLDADALEKDENGSGEEDESDDESDDDDDDTGDRIVGRKGKRGELGGGRVQDKGTNINSNESSISSSSSSISGSVNSGGVGGGESGGSSSGGDDNGLFAFLKRCRIHEGAAGALFRPCQDDDSGKGGPSRAGEAAEAPPSELSASSSSSLSAFFSSEKTLFCSGFGNQATRPKRRVFSRDMAEDDVAEGVEGGGMLGEAAANGGSRAFSSSLPLVQASSAQEVSPLKRPRRNHLVAAFGAGETEQGSGGGGGEGGEGFGFRFARAQLQQGEGRRFEAEESSSGDESASPLSGTTATFGSGGKSAGAAAGAAAIGQHSATSSVSTSASARSGSGGGPPSILVISPKRPLPLPPESTSSATGSSSPDSPSSAWLSPSSPCFGDTSTAGHPCLFASSSPTKRSKAANTSSAAAPAAAPAVEGGTAPAMMASSTTTALPALLTIPPLTASTNAHAAVVSPSSLSLSPLSIFSPRADTVHTCSPSSGSGGSESSSCWGHINSAAAATRGGGGGGGESGGGGGWSGRGTASTTLPISSSSNSFFSGVTSGHDDMHFASHENGGRSIACLCHGSCVCRNASRDGAKESVRLLGLEDFL